MAPIMGIFTRGQFWPSGIVVASVCLSVCLCVRQSLACPRDNLSPVQARITKFGPEEQNTLVKIPIVLGVNWPWTSRSNLTLKWKITIFSASPCHHSPPIQDKISKFEPQMHLSTVKIPINFGLDWHCPSISFLISKPILYQPEKMLFASFLLYILEWDHPFQVTPHMLLVWGDLQVESFEWSHWSINISTQYFDSGNAIEP